MTSWTIWGRENLQNCRKSSGTYSSQQSVDMQITLRCLYNYCSVSNLGACKLHSSRQEVHLSHRVLDKPSYKSVRRTIIYLERLGTITE
jgi:hypothetical protein